jgi:hypothetical protein
MYVLVRIFWIQSLQIERLGISSDASATAMEMWKGHSASMLKRVLMVLWMCSLVSLNVFFTSRTLLYFLFMVQMLTWNESEPTQQFRSSLPDFTHGTMVHPIDNFVAFTARVVDDSPNTANVKQVLVDAGIISLLLAMLTDELDDSCSTLDLLESGQPGVVDTAKLLDSICSKGVNRMFKKTESVFPYRRRILCRAFHLFYDSPDASSWTSMGDMSLYFRMYDTQSVL